MPTVRLSEQNLCVNPYLESVPVIVDCQLLYSTTVVQYEHLPTHDTMMTEGFFGNDRGVEFQDNDCSTCTTYQNEEHPCPIYRNVEYNWY